MFYLVHTRHEKKTSREVKKNTVFLMWQNPAGLANNFLEPIFALLRSSSHDCFYWCVLCVYIYISNINPITNFIPFHFENF